MILSNTTRLYLCLLLAAMGCQSQDIVAKRVESNMIDGTIDDGMIDDGTIDDGMIDEDVCGRQGPLLRVGDNIFTETSCAEGNTGKSFQNALCLCGGYAMHGSLFTDSFDSRDLDNSNRMEQGSVSINGEIAGTQGVASTQVRVGGSLSVAGAAGVTFPPSSNCEIEEDLEVAGELWGNQVRVAVSGDARVGSRIDLGDLEIGGSLTLPEGVEVIISGVQNIGTRIRDSVDVTPRCGCDDDDIIDIQAQADKYRSENHNQLLNFDIDKLTYSDESSIQAKLPCGWYYLDEMYLEGSLELSVTAPAVLYIPGQMRIEGALTVELEQDASLDLFIGGNLAVRGNLTLGEGDSRERVRLYVGGQEKPMIEFGAESLIAGFVYAPRAELKTTGLTEVYGSVFVRRIAGEGDLIIHYDRNPLEAGQRCVE